MTIPDFQTVMLPVLRDLSRGDRTGQETLDALASEFARSRIAAGRTLNSQIPFPLDQTMTAKYQVFLSSTYEDLKHEREQVIKATLEMGHIPVGMEMFSAADDEQWRIITRHIDESDYYVVVIAHRYGSMDGTVSYTEKEYDYAVRQGIPVLGFIIELSASWPADRNENDPVKRGALAEFKEKVKRKPVGFWSSADDLHGKYSIALMKLLTAHPRPGWIRAVGLPGPEVMTELSRLSRENAELRTSIDRERKQQSLDEVSRVERVFRTLSSNKRKIVFWEIGNTNWSEGVERTLQWIFQRIAPEMMVEASVQRLAAIIALHASNLSSDKLRRESPVPNNTIALWLADLTTLELIAPSSRRHSVNDKNQYWCLTTFGREVWTRVLRARLEAGLQPEVVQSASEPLVDATQSYTLPEEGSEPTS
jgi:hypothetical protein